MIKIDKKNSKLVRKRKHIEEEKPTTKTCPFCYSEININATRCPNCTSELEKIEKD